MFRYLYYGSNEPTDVECLLTPEVVSPGRFAWLVIVGLTFLLDQLPVLLRMACWAIRVLRRLMTAARLSVLGTHFRILHERHRIERASSGLARQSILETELLRIIQRRAALLRLEMLGFQVALQHP
jgi:hypothetical protein